MAEKTKQQFDLEVELVNGNKMTFANVIYFRVDRNYNSEINVMVKYEPDETETRTVELHNIDVADVMLARSDIPRTVEGEALEGDQDDMGGPREGTEGGGPENLGEALPAGAPSQPATQVGEAD